MSELRAELARRILIADGAIGTVLQAATRVSAESVVDLNERAPAVVSAMHESYATNGADIVQTNTYGANRFRLGVRGRGGDVRTLNLAGVELVRAAVARVDRRPLIAGTVSPVAPADHRDRVPPDQRRHILAEQVDALRDAGVDLIMLETFGHLDEIIEAVEVVEHTELPVIAQATFTATGRTPSGHRPDQIGRALHELAVDVIGINCTVGPQQMLTLLEELAASTSRPLSVQPNAGMPKRNPVDNSLIYAADAEYLASYVNRFADAGANIVGGCCGTSPAVTKAMADAAVGLVPRRPPSPSVARRSDVVSGSDRNAHRHDASTIETAVGLTVAVQLAVAQSDDVDDVLDRARLLKASGADAFYLPLPAEPGLENRLDVAIALRERLASAAFLTVGASAKSAMALQAEMLALHALGVTRVVCVSGHPPVGDYVVRDETWQTDSIGLVSLLNELNSGRDSNGLPLNTDTSFLIAARCGVDPRTVGQDRERAREKVRRGAHLLMTQPVYRSNEVIALRRSLPRTVPIWATIRLVRSSEEAEFLHQEVPRAHFPRSLRDVLREAGPDAGARSSALGLDLVREIRGSVDGIVVAADDHEQAARFVEAVRQLVDPPAAGTRADTDPPD